MTIIRDVKYYDRTSEDPAVRIFTITLTAGTNVYDLKVFSSCFTVINEFFEDDRIQITLRRLMVEIADKVVEEFPSVLRNDVLNFVYTIARKEDFGNNTVFWETTQKDLLAQKKMAYGGVLYTPPNMMYFSTNHHPSSNWLTEKYFNKFKFHVENDYATWSNQWVTESPMDYMSEMLQSVYKLYNHDSDSVSELSRKLPAMDEIAQCPRCATSRGPLRSIIMHLNDWHRITREDLADWLDEWADANSIDISFPTPEEVKSEHSHRPKRRKVDFF